MPPDQSCSDSATRHVLSGLNGDGVLSLDRSDLLEQPVLERLYFSDGLRARRIHDEVRVPRGHASGKEPNQPPGCQVRFDERCTRQGDAEAGNGRRKEQIFLTVTRSLTGIAIVQA